MKLTLNLTTEITANAETTNAILADEILMLNQKDPVLDKETRWIHLSFEQADALREWLNKNLPR